MFLLSFCLPPPPPLPSLRLFTQFRNARLVPAQRRWPNTPPSHTPGRSPRVKPIGPPRESPHLPSRLPTSARIRVLPLGLRHGHGSLSLPHPARAAHVLGRVKGIKQQCWEGNGRHVRDVLQSNVMMRCRGILKVDQGLHRTWISNAAGKKKNKIKKPLHEEIQATASYSRAFNLFSATTGRWSVIFSLV